MSTMQRMLAGFGTFDRGGNWERMRQSVRTANKRLYDLNQDELDALHNPVVSVYGHASVTSAINDMNCWKMTVGEFLDFIEQPVEE